MSELFTSQNVIALLTLTCLEIVLGIDNIIFLSILTGGLPEKKRPRARIIGLGLAMGGRICLLLGISWVMKLTNDLFHLFGHGISGKDLILLLGGLFLVGKSTHEIHAKLESGDKKEVRGSRSQNFAATMIQIVLIDLVFSLDSVITAIGMAQQILIMILAVIIAVGVMMLFAGAISNFVERHPTIKMLALAFLILIGVMLVAESFGQHISKGYIYFAMAFSVGVEFLNMRMRKNMKSKTSKGG